jgi:predicted metal-binding membrane protein
LVGSTPSASSGIAHLHPGAAQWSNGSGLAPALLMVVAMMLPLAAPGVRHVSFATFPSRRARSVLGFLLIYVGVWLAAITVIDFTIQSATRADRILALVAAFAAAALWQLSPAKRRALLRCHGTPAIGARGWRADLSCMRFGASLSLNCAASCWLLMAAAIAAGDLWATAVIFVVQIAERFGPPANAQIGGGVLGGLGLLVLAAYLGRV